MTLDAAAPADLLAARPRRSSYAVILVVLDVMAIGAAVLSLHSSSTPGGSFWTGIGAGAIWMVVGVAWLVSILWWLVRGPRSLRRLPGWLVVPLIVVVTLSLIGTDLPLRARFAASRGAFEALVANPPPQDASVGAGLYQVAYSEPTAFGYQFAVDSGLFVVQGFAYSPNGPPGPDIDSVENEGDQGYRHLDGPWYIWIYKDW